MLENIDT